MLEAETPCELLLVKYRVCVEEGKPEYNHMERTG
jgi:hypothetical protein